MASTDERIAAGQTGNPRISSCWRPCCGTPPCVSCTSSWRSTVPMRWPLHERGPDHRLGGNSTTSAIPRRFTQPMREIWEFQLQAAAKRRNRKPAELVGHRRFPRGLRSPAAAGTGRARDLEGLGEWWTDIQEKYPPPDAPPTTGTGNRRVKPSGHAADVAVAARGGNHDPCTRCFIALGSNLDRPIEQVETALQALATEPGCALLSCVAALQLVPQCTPGTRRPT